MKPPMFRFKVNQQPLGCTLHGGCRNNVMCINNRDIWSYLLSAEFIEDGPHVRHLFAAIDKLTHFFFDPETPFGTYIYSLSRTQRFQTILYSIRHCNYLTLKNDFTLKRILPLLPKKRHYPKHHFDHIRNTLTPSGQIRNTLPPSLPPSFSYHNKPKRTQRTSLAAKLKPRSKHHFWYPPLSDKIPFSTRPLKSSPNIKDGSNLPEPRAGIG